MVDNNYKKKVWVEPQIVTEDLDKTLGGNFTSTTENTFSHT